MKDKTFKVKPIPIRDDNPTEEQMQKFDELTVAITEITRAINKELLKPSKTPRITK